MILDKLLCLIGLHNWMPDGYHARYCFHCHRRQRLVGEFDYNYYGLVAKYWKDE